MIKLTKVELNLSGRWFVRYYFFRFIGKVFSYIPFYPQILSILRMFLNDMTRATYSEHAYRQNLTKAGGSDINPVEFDSGYGYENPEEERRVGLMYKGEIVSGQYANAESPVLYEHAISILSNILKEGNIKQVVNFGVSYAYVDSVVAKKFQNVKFVGVDRSTAIKQLNDEEFPLPNMSFVAADIIDWIDSQNDMSTTLFFSMRTCVLLPQKFIDTLYSKLGQKKTAIIVGFEPYGLSRATNSAYQQEYTEKPSVLFRDTMFLHNYAGILLKNGYDLHRLEYLMTGHVDKDVRIQSFTAIHNKIS